MRAAIFPGGERVSLVERPRPVAGPGEALVRVRRTAFCGSDIKAWRKGIGVVPGHEIFGVVETRGHALEGRRVCVYIPEHCGSCAACARGLTQLCMTHSSLVGWNRDGGYAEYVAAPDDCLLPVPDDIPDDLAPLLLDGIGTATHGLDLAARAGVTEGPALVMGAGAIGLGVIVALRDRGYDTVEVIEPNPARREIAAALGATLVDAPRPRRHALILECSGNLAARQAAIESVAPAGAVVLLGENDAVWPLAETRAVRRNDFYLIRSFYFPKADFSANIAALRRNVAAYRRIADAAVTLDEFPAAFAAFAAGAHVKPALAFD